MDKEWWVRKEKKLRAEEKESRCFKKELKKVFKRPDNKITIAQFYAYIKRHPDSLGLLIMFLDRIQASNRLNIFLECKKQMESKK